MSAGGEMVAISLVDFVDRDVLEHLLDGFCYRLGMPVSLQYLDATAGRTEAKALRARAPAHEPSGFEHPLCTEARSRCPADCAQLDVDSLQKYLRGEWSGPRLYRCHLQLWGMAQPLVVEERQPILLGVLMAGQVVARHDADDWRSALAIVASQVEWSSVDPQDRQRQPDAVLRAIRSRFPEHEQSLAAKLNEGEEVHAAELLHRFSEFVAFGNRVKPLLQRLYSDRRDHNTRASLQRSAERFLTSSLTDEAAWSRDCDGILTDLAAEVGLVRTRLYVRKSKFFVRLVPGPEPVDRVAARDVLSSVQTGALVSSSSTPAASALAELLGAGQTETSFFLYQRGIGEHNLGSLLVLEGSTRRADVELLARSAKLVCQQAIFASLVFQQSDTQHRHRVEVARAAHDFRTPLQAIIIDLERVRLASATADPELAALVEDSLIRALAAKDHALRLQASATERWEDIDLCRLVAEVMQALEPVACRHPCQLVRVGRWPDTAVVHGRQYELRSAFMNLIENAIKYSYEGVDAEKRLHEVRVGIGRMPNGLVRVEISNYGIGIPENKLEVINRPGERAAVPDPRRKDRQRPGTGWGLPIAIRALSGHHGWLVLTSKPTGGSERAESEKYHRYLTTATVHLPLA